MKKHLSFFLFCIMICVFNSACQKEDENPLPPVKEEPEIVDEVNEEEPPNNGGGGFECTWENPLYNPYSDYFPYEIGEELFFRSSNGIMRHPVIYAFKIDTIYYSTVGYHGEWWETCTRRIRAEYEFDWAEDYRLVFSLTTRKSGWDEHFIASPDFGWDNYVPLVAEDEYHDIITINGKLLTDVAIYSPFVESSQEYITRIIVKTGVGLVGFEHNDEWWLLE